ncbi:mycothione reductase [Corynebacterium pseudotuberculosis]|uniref:Mycothione reductase n=2 Tax=Corynebacterium pseudotuberculosis TaxID=1719 RepID=D9QB41_CORP2|nr:mycothione reductase [Corynebacterium pseudotuberculosis]AER69338.1 Mycothione/glutathione reductase [Corynebacterium pseudotuberculosis 1/06-A]ADK29091.1 mycothione reductase [Corynebacterium pseudotuberculosis FRC41]ADL10767.1 mycothione reductase [Corynebacterium pseudotuberculosis C231]ADL21174.1 mycothione reductase [Corynebacterium pseudotuberculosis 1002]ADO26565.1 mycothione reductase [Corynebacterium pseudotuberculosis I19]
MSEQAHKHYDLIIIGTGSGNSIPGPEFHDKSIAIVEKGAFGGTCLNVGCIPTKMFVYASEIALAVRESERYGISAEVSAVDWPSIVNRVFRDRIDPISASGEEYRRGPKTPNIDVYDQHASFVAPKTIRTGQGDKEAIISGDRIVIATGSRPFIDQKVIDSGVHYYTNETIMRLESLPTSMVVMGGGYIAMEFAHVFDALGVKVTVVNRSQKLLRQLDSDISDRFTEITKEKLDCRLGRTIQSITENDGTVTLTLDDGSTAEGEVFLVATGRIPNGDLMDLDNAGVEMDGRRIKVDQYGRTTAPDVWALGDVSSPYLLKHVANAEMRAVKHNLLHPEDLQSMPHENVPAAVFTHPQIGTVGLTEDEARAAGYNITVKIQNYGDVAYGWAMEDTEHFVKLIADKDTGLLLGAHFIGPQASTLVQQLITVMAFKLDVRDVATKQYWIHPALPELTENALLGLDFS